ncbi:MAG: amidophosphoribosyltransferase [Bacteroidales bacterium]
MEQLKHECGIAMVRLLKPLEYYQEKYGTWMYGLNKLYLLMEKQHNRGQEGAGLACLKMEAHPGEEYLFRERAMGSGAITDIFAAVHENFKDIDAETLRDATYAKTTLPFAGEIYMGHLRYSTTGRSGLSFVHPFIRRNNWRAKSLTLCGNFNLTNVDEIFDEITADGQHPRKYADTYIMLEQIGHRLDREVERLFQIAKSEGLQGMDITHQIEANLNMENVLRSASPRWDGGYVMCGLTGSGDAFTFRDPWGIRPAFYYADDEIVVVASERPVIQTALGVAIDSIKELEPGQGILINKEGQMHLAQINAPKQIKKCSFERIYFSRGSDRDIYRERKRLGRNLVPAILQAVDQDLDHSVFSFIPNTAEVAYYGMLQGLEEANNIRKSHAIAALGGNATPEQIAELLAHKVRSEKIAIKDIKLRTFIAEGNSRNDLAAHVYDVTYGTVEAGKDNLVVIDDSIVRGTTLRQSIIKILDTLEPKKIIIVSSSPQIRYPDCYGIDMSRMGEFIAFRAAIALLQESGRQDLIDSVYARSKAQQELPKEQIVNYVKEIYKPFTAEQISAKIAQMLTPANTRAEVEIIYQTIEGLHDACPGHTGDWYFTGDYPTPGGNRLVNNAFINYYEGFDSKRS